MILMLLWVYIHTGQVERTSIPKVSGSIPIVIRLTFQPAWCEYTLRETSKTLYSPEYITPKHAQKYHIIEYIGIEGTRISSEIPHTWTELA
jgi:hypothetical protein